MAFVSLLYLAIVVLMIASLWIIFQKAGKPGWACIIPIYNIIVWLQIIGKPWWWLLLMMIPFVNFIFLIWMYNLTSKVFGNGVGFTIGLLFLPFIFFPILAFGGSTYTKPATAW